MRNSTEVRTGIHATPDGSLRDLERESHDTAGRTVRQHRNKLSAPTGQFPFPYRTTIVKYLEYFYHPLSPLPLSVTTPMAKQTCTTGQHACKPPL